MATRKNGASRAAESTIAVLIANDQQLLREGMQCLLAEQGGIRVVGAVGDGESAVREAVRQAPQVVLLDLASINRSAIDAARALGQKAPEVRVIAISGHAAPHAIRSVFEAGVRGFLTRRCAVAELVRAIRAVTAGKRYLAEDLAGALAEPERSSAGRTERKAVERLTASEYEIVRLVSDGNSNQEVAGILGLSPRTVETYRLRLMRKLGIDDLPGLVKYAIREGITALE
jgi:DNA-binding NarL/FixJ family response regulator